MDENPLKTERVLRNLTQKQLADLAGISQNAVVKYEHGLYHNPSDNIISAFIAYDRAHVTAVPILATTNGYKPYITRLYQIWRVKKLQSARSDLQGGRYYGSLERPVGLHPFADWRINYLKLTSQLGLCKLLVLHPSILSQYESGHTRYMPADIKFALNACSLPETTIEALDIEGSLFFDSFEGIAV